MEDRKYRVFFNKLGSKHVYVAEFEKTSGVVNYTMALGYILNLSYQGFYRDINDEQWLRSGASRDAHLVLRDINKGTPIYILSEAELTLPADEFLNMIEMVL